MNRVIEAVYKNGVLTPVEPLDLPEQLRVLITIQVPGAEGPEDALQAWGRVYEGLSEEDVAAVECIALSDRKSGPLPPHSQLSHRKLAHRLILRISA
jgi:predicted DNA-binding antitoxin AbrB/MazE fold protein